jgi:ubiquinone/menaquinone biosynthesis C-methylase UbiE
MESVDSKQNKKNEMLQRDKEAAIYDTVLTSKYFHRIETDSCIEKLDPQKGELILDAGCGTGRFSEEMAARGVGVVAVDYSMESLRICKKRCKDFNVKPLIIRADICDLPFKPGIVGKVLSVGVFQHIPTKKGSIGALREMRRVLKPNGKLVITVYGYDLPCRILRDKSGYHAGKIYYYNYSYREFREILSSVFGVVEICGILNFLKYRWFIQDRLTVLDVVLEKTRIFSIMERLDRTMEKTVFSHILGHFLCACTEKQDI